MTDKLPELPQPPQQPALNEFEFASQYMAIVQFEIDLLKNWQKLIL